jgi:O-acetyl-ADP-ribose deacetylase (regulator of RNase III)
MKLIKGNLLETECYQIAHGCNAQGVMGSGVAKAIREWCPSVYAVYRNAYEVDGLRLGDVITANGPNKLVHNIITQDQFGWSGSRFVNYAAVASGLIKIFKKADSLPAKYSRLAIPEIGCGLGGGDRDVLFSIFEDVEKMYLKVELWVYSLDN